MAEIKIGDEVVLVEPFKVFRLLADGRLDICDSDGNCISVNPNQVTLKQTTMKAMKDAVLGTAKDLLRANNTVTTLEIKGQLRKDYPYYYWDQSTVSKYMNGFAGDGIFSYTDNGTYRTYSLVNVTKKAPVIKPTTKTVVYKAAKSLIIKTPRKTVSRGNLLNFIQKAVNVEGVYTVSGHYVSTSDIRNQKKSLIGYISQRPNIVAIQVNGTKITVR